MSQTINGMQRLTTGGIAPYRQQLLAGRQRGLCSLCKRRPTVPCLDHCHSTGVIRGVLCRGCNALLGKIENNAARNGLRGTALNTYLMNIPQYLAFGEQGGLGILHPTHKTEDEKRLARNAKAVKARAAKKV